MIKRIVSLIFLLAAVSSPPAWAWNMPTTSSSAGSDLIPIDTGSGSMQITRTNLFSSLSSTYQPLDSDLTIWAGITPSVNVQALAAAANYAAIRALLDLEVGTDVQSYDADLATWAGLSPSSNAQSLVTAANYSAMRTLLSLVPGTDVQAYRAELLKVYAAGSDIPSSGTIDLGAANGDYVNVTGTTTITALGTATAGIERTVTFPGILTLTHNATSLILPGGASITTAAGDSAIFRSLGSGNWRCILYTSAASTTALLAANNLSDVANVATAQQNLNLEPGVDIQPYDAELNAIAGLTSAADRLPYFIGSGSAALATFTAAGRAIVDDADAAAQRTTLGLAIGTNVQAFDADLTTYAGITPSANVQTFLGASNYAAMRTQLGLVVGTDVQAFDADLSALAGLTSAADKGIYFTGSGTAGTYDLSSFSRTVLDDTTAAAWKTTLGIDLLRIFTITSNTGNIGAGEDTLTSQNVTSGTLPTNNSSALNFDLFGKVGNTANNKRLRLKWDGTTIFDSGTFTDGQNKHYRLTGRMIRTSSTQSRCIVEFEYCGTAVTDKVQYTIVSGANFDSSTYVLLLTGEATADNDLEIFGGVALRDY